MGLRLDDIAPIVAIFDITTIHRVLHGLDFDKLISLESLLQQLGCPADNLHDASNDAHFTLRALLLLAVQYQ